MLDSMITMAEVHEHLPKDRIHGDGSSSFIKETK